MKHWPLATVLLAPLLWTGSATAAVTYELKIGSIAGGSTVHGYTGWIDVSSFSWGVTHAGSTGGGGGGVGKAVFQDFAWTQGIDTSIVPIFLGVAKGTHFPKAELDVIKAGKDAAPFFEMIFGTAMLTGLDIAGTGAVPTASASLDYSQITMRYRPQRADGSLGTWIEGTFSLVKNAVVFSGDEDVLVGLFESGGDVNPGALATTAVPVPEPTSWALMLGGLGALGWTTRRRASPQA